MNRIDCTGDICPVPVIKTKKALAEANHGLEVLVDNEIAVQNISKLLNSLNCSFSTLQETSKDGTYFLISIAPTVGGVTSQPQTLPPILKANVVPPQASSLVVISSEMMGAGDSTLGKLLIKGFIFALTQLETLPTTIIFYNTGVRHTLKSSESIKDLQYLHQNGVDVLVCGTCLSHFNATDDLAVGEITNMYDIVNLMQQAGCVIRP